MYLVKNHVCLHACHSPFVAPAVMVPVEDAMDYARDILAGVDNLLIELSNDLIDDLPNGLTPQQRQHLQQVIRARIAAARAAVDEHETFRNTRARSVPCASAPPEG